MLVSVLFVIHYRITQGGGWYSITFNFHANIWSPKFYVKSIFGVCESQHGEKCNIWGFTNLKKGRIMEFGVRLQNTRFNIWGPQNISHRILGSAKKYVHRPPPVLNVREYPLGHINVKVIGNTVIRITFCSVPCKRDLSLSSLSRSAGLVLIMIFISFLL